MKRTLVAGVLCVVLTGCTWRDAMFLHPRTAELQAAVAAEVQAAYTLGEQRGFGLSRAGHYAELDLRLVQVDVDAEIKRCAEPEAQITTGRVAMILRARGVSESDALAAVEEINGVAGRQALLISEYAGLEHRRVVQSYLQGLFDGIDVGLPQTGGQ